MVYKIQLKRLARRLFWPRPALYRPLGILRKKGDVFQNDYDLYISGYPRSGNTFSVKAFLLANSDARLRSHKHIPAFIIQSAKWNLPGMVLIRKPIDAAVSWAIYTNTPLYETLVYYTDFYNTLRSCRQRLFFVTFEEVTNDFGKVITDFNARWNTNYVPFRHVPENVAQCISTIEDEYTDSNGAIIESRVARPSVHREPMKEVLLQEFNSSQILQKELFRANEIYQFLVSGRINSL
ncbi:MAG: hypothetical protein PHR77_01330 [Kiritimatiellae bacterium]|nr:hypothetical protein [Kiritimatiellia bacterium]MDD5522015.1 hypothetical protein [Kiritimatiellia bacterium]